MTTEREQATTHALHRAGCVAACAAISVALLLVCAARAGAQVFEESEHLTAPISAVQLIYLPEHGTLVLKNSASAVSVVRIADGSSSNHLAVTGFLDMSASQEGDYVYVADYGGENIGYGTPRTPSYVHRLAVQSGNWEVKGAYIAGRIEATTAGRFLLMSLDQWVSITLNEWGTGSEVIELGGTSWTVYSGDIEYDFATARIIHGNSGLSSQEIQAFRINGTSIVLQEGSGGYGSASGQGGSSVLATDGSAFYYGRLSVDGLDVSSNHLVFPEVIHAATSDLAFGAGRYFDASTGEELGVLPIATTVYGLNRNGCDFWAYDGSTNMLRHYVPATGGPCEQPEPPVPDAGAPDAGDMPDAGVEPDAGTDAGGPVTTPDEGGGSGSGGSADTDAAVACNDAEREDAAIDAAVVPAPEEEGEPADAAIAVDAAPPSCRDAGASAHGDAGQPDAGAADAGDSLSYPDRGCSTAGRPTTSSATVTGALLLLVGCCVRRARSRLRRQ